ncbi:MAG: phosphatidate cytidylyltransferase [Acidobacteriota bacterium]
MSSGGSSTPSGLRARVVTGVVGAFLVLGVVFALPPDLAFFVWLAVVTGAAVEFVRIGRHFAPSAPLGVVWWAMPAAAFLGYSSLVRGEAWTAIGVLGAGFAVILLATLANLMTDTDVRDAAVGTGLIAFAVPYFAIPVVAVFGLHRESPWLLVLLCLIVAAGDTFAYFVGRAIGRRPLAPRISPKKTWEGTIGGFAGSLLVTAIWSQVRLGEVRPTLLGIAAATAIVAPLGDLAESMMKRAAGVKDSSRILPGHGGLYDRLDSILLAAPTFLVGLWLVGIEIVRP